MHNTTNDTTPAARLAEGICPACGRDYSDGPETHCSSDDCPAAVRPGILLVTGGYDAPEVYLDTESNRQVVWASFVHDAVQADYEASSLCSDAYFARLLAEGEIEAGKVTVQALPFADHWHKVNPAVVVELAEALERLSEKVARANSLQHSGGRVVAEDWAELYQLGNEARAVLAKAKGEM